ncbi:MAG TPA: OmpA family protein [Alphaproteobacteria bacterium]|nr:OmpA family protein [Alphaproteobacteria bacterium]
MSDPITMQTSRSLALLLGTAAISIVLTSPAHADVIIDQQQLTGQGKSVAEQAYGDVRQVRSPLGGISILPVSNEPVVISSRGAGTKSSLAASANAPIALKPLSKWGLAVPATPISTGARTAILLKPPGNVNQVINQLAKQSPLRNAPMQTADATPLRLRPPAPIPPAPQFAQVPMPNTQVIVPMLAAIQPQTQIQMVAASAPETTVAPAPMQMAMNAAPAAAAVPVSQMGELRAEDVVALDLGAPPSTTATPASAPAAPAPEKTEMMKPVAAPPAAAAPEEKSDSDILPDVPKFMPPLDDEPAVVKTSDNMPAPEPVQTANAEPQFISPLTEGLPMEEEKSSSNETSDKVALAAPAAVPVSKATREEAQTDKNKNLILADATPAELSAKAKEVVAKAEIKNVLPDIPPALPAEMAATHASADEAADAVALSLAEPIEKQNTPVPVPPETTLAIASGAAMTADRVEISNEGVSKTEAAEANAKLAAALQEKEAAEKARIEAENAARLQAEEAAQKLAAAEEARKLAEAEAAAQAKAVAEAEMKAREKAEATLKAQADEMARQQQAEIERLAAEAKLQADEMARQQQAEIARIEAEAKAQSSMRAETMAQEQAEAIAKAQLEADARAVKQAQEMAKEQAEILMQSRLAANDPDDLDAVKVNESKIKDMARQQLADARERIENKSRAVPVQPVEHTTLVELPKIVQKSNIQEASLSAGAMTDAGGAMAETAPLVQKTVLFQSGISALPSDASAAVSELAQQMKNNRDAKLIINAYADSSSQTGAASRRLSLQRAILIRDALNKQGVPISRVEVRAQTAAPGEINPDRADIVLQ